MFLESFIFPVQSWGDYKEERENFELSLEDC